ncbi:hypothetical protein IC220_06120 [Wolbachia endosymbiont of Pentalonia nigronervosa]|jgi:hypothetical protein|uniref:hypothetical protein n=1 Tax=Wolbachia endosymbiont of Pentalonia nigronervosa TaxID=1301914 RepID=UPI00165FA702|nr:hypothetical protein [Wolbachia endosymbiont of Pentalonia nigronervosa]MBD0391993.1 hypothetical protein [Wolbachia endosymbiont of Pentalonia nigronervosa]
MISERNDVRLFYSQPISNLFLTSGIITFCEALNYVHRLPYGRNLDCADYLSVLNEKCGTCSTKHALIYKLGCECGVDITLHMAIFMMDKINTPAISSILEKFNLLYIPEMHCYLRYKGQIIDITFPEDNKPLELIDEEKIEPEYIGDYKMNKHKQYIENWLPRNTVYNSEQIFRIRELCIEQLIR